MTTAELFGVSNEVARALKTMSHMEYLEIGVVLMTRVQKLKLEEYNSREFTYRAKAIKNYMKWSNE